MIPAAVYITGNLFPNESRPSTLKRCSDLDKVIRKLLVDNKIIGKTNSRTIIYIPTSFSGFGLKSIRYATEAYFVRKYLYLINHPEMQDVKNRYCKLEKKEWRNPISDSKYILHLYAIDMNKMREHEKINEYIKNIIKMVEAKQQKLLIREWEVSFHSARLITKEHSNIKFPALTNFRLQDWQAKIARQAAEEQLVRLRGSGPHNGNCRNGCPNKETAYHVISACPTPQKTARQDLIVYWILKTILYNTEAPTDIIAQLQYSEASLIAQYQWKERQIKIKAGVKFKTDIPVYHNKPDIVIELTNPNQIYVIEVSIAYLQNITLQEQIKEVRYSANSKIQITKNNYKEVHRDTNLIDQISHHYNKPTDLAILVFGALGEILETQQYLKAKNILSKLGISSKKFTKLEEICSYNILNQSSKILVRRMADQ